MENQNTLPPQGKPGLFSGIGGLTKNMFGLLVSRIELAALEFSEVRGNFLKIVLLGALGLVTAWFAIAYWSILVVMLAWPSLGWIILLIMGLGFTAVTVGLFLYLKSQLAQGKLSMPATMAELRHDRDTLL
jgi:uncharacterized membrane protein YqjE